MPKAGIESLSIQGLRQGSLFNTLVPTSSPSTCSHETEGMHFTSASQVAKIHLELVRKTYGRFARVRLAWIPWNDRARKTLEVQHQ